MEQIFQDQKGFEKELKASEKLIKELGIDKVVYEKIIFEKNRLHYILEALIKHLIVFREYTIKRGYSSSDALHFVMQALANSQLALKSLSETKKLAFKIIKEDRNEKEELNRKAYVLLNLEKV